MPALPLNEAIQQAQDAISSGNYRLAVETCRDVLAQFPEFATAHRLLGEAYLEQRAADDAERAFHETLRRDPHNLPAYVGLGLIAEERKDTRTALAYLQAAWENAPQRTDLRDRVVKAAQEVYGPDGRLQLTRAGLGSLHFFAGRWGRAVHECAAVLAEFPSRVDVRMRLAAALWLRGEDERAAATCRAILEEAPNAVVALLILADVTRRQGDTSEANALLERARAVDPDGTLAATLVASGRSAAAEFLVPSEMPRLEERDETQVEPERPRIAPAPDFMAPAPETDGVPVPAASEAPAEPVAAADAVDLSDIATSLPTNEEIEAARPADTPTAGYTGLLRSLEGEGFEPFSTDDFGAALAHEPEGETELLGEPEQLDQSEKTAAFHEEVARIDSQSEAAAADDLDDLAALLGVSSDQEIAAARPPEVEPHGYTSLLHSLEESGLAPFTVGGTEADTISAESSDALVAEAPAGGHEAVDESRAALVESEDAVQEEVARSEPADAAADVSATVAADWNQIDDEIRNAIPGEMPKGYTDELRSIDASGVEPFSFDDGEIPFFQRSRRSAAEPAQPGAAVDESLRPFSIDEIPEAVDLPLDLESLESLGDLDDLDAPLEDVGLDPVESESEAEPTPSLDVEDWDLSEVVASPVSDEAEKPGVGMLTDDDLLAELEAAHEQAIGGRGEPESDAPSLSDLLEEDTVESESAATEVAASTAEEDAASGPASEAEPAALGAALGRLGVGTDLFKRARDSKADLVIAGQIEGNKPLTAASDDVAPEPAAEAEIAEEAAVPESVDETPSAPLEVVPPNLEVLREAVRQRPADVAARLALAEALVGAGDGPGAFAEFRAAQQSPGAAGEAGERLIAGLTRLIEVDAGSAAGAHRLLGSIYRKRGDVGRASRHYALSLELTRRAAPSERKG